MNNLKTTSAKIMGITLVLLVGISFVWAQDFNYSLDFETIETEESLDENEFEDLSDIDKTSLLSLGETVDGTLSIQRYKGQPSIKSAGTDNLMVIDSNGNLTSINHYVSDNVLLGYGGGNIGIGRLNPLAKFDIYNSTVLGENINDSVINQVVEGGAEGDKLHFKTVRFEAGTNHEYTEERIQRNVNNYANMGYISFAGGGSTWTNRATHIGYGNNRIATFHRSGKVGIGKINPTEKLDVVGNIKLSGNIVSDGDICIGHCQ